MEAINFDAINVVRRLIAYTIKQTLGSTMNIKQHSTRLTVSVLGLTTFLWGCQSFPLMTTSSAVESLLICQDTPSAVKLKNDIKKQFGFRKIATDSYSPSTELRVLGHSVSVIELNEQYNRFYVLGRPMEFAHHVEPLTKSIQCKKNQACEAVINKNQILKIHKPRNKKLKRTSVIECRYPKKPAKKLVISPKQ